MGIYTDSFLVKLCWLLLEDSLILCPFSFCLRPPLRIEVLLQHRCLQVFSNPCAINLQPCESLVCLSFADLKTKTPSINFALIATSQFRSATLTCTATMCRDWLSFWTLRPYLLTNKEKWKIIMDWITRLRKGVGQMQNAFLNWIQDIEY